MSYRHGSSLGREQRGGTGQRDGAADREYQPPERVDYTRKQVTRAPGSVKVRTGGDSPRASHEVDLVELRDRR
jgi:hypothetical protein